MIVPDVELFDRLLEILPSPVAVSDRAGLIVLFNSAAEALLGYSQTEALGLHASELYQYPELAPRLMARLRSSDGHGGSAAEPTEVVLRSRDGTPIPARMAACLLRDANGQPAGVVAVYTDLRETRALERGLDQAKAQVSAAERRAARLSAASNLTHAMSQPLTAAMGNIELALMNRDPSGHERLQRCFEQLERIAQIHQELTGVLVSRVDTLQRS